MDRSEWLKGLLMGDQRAIARCLSIVENDAEGADELLLQLQQKEIPVIGFTGPPGAGKSTLVNAYIRHLLAQNKKIAVLAVDPSSPFNYGALLGDRIRMLEHFKNPNLFVRSVATRGSLGGLSSKIIDMVEVLKSAGFDEIIIETVGVGQSEVDIVGVADITLVVLVPEAGDQIQGMKAGLMEIADIFVINKSDREGAESIYNSIQQMLMYRRTYHPIPIVQTVATEEKGVITMAEEIEKLLGQQVDINERKVVFIAHKIYKTIQKEKMRGVLITQIIDDVKLNYKKEYNIYKYINNYKSKFNT
jgi:LAO/AO transport system kinase